MRSPNGTAHVYARTSNEVIADHPRRHRHVRCTTLQKRRESMAAHTIRDGDTRRAIPALARVDIGVSRIRESERLRQVTFTSRDVELLRTFPREQERLPLHLVDTSTPELHEDPVGLRQVPCTGHGDLPVFRAFDGAIHASTYLLQHTYDSLDILGTPAASWHETFGKNRTRAINNTRCPSSESGKRIQLAAFDATRPTIMEGLADGDMNAARRLRISTHEVETALLTDSLTVTALT